MKIHRFTFIAALALGTVLAGTSISSAQSTNAPAREGRGRTVQQRVDRMSTELNLTAEQKTKVTALFQEEAKKREELRIDTNMPREEKREKGRALMADQEKKLKEILTPEQQEKWQKIREQFRPRRQQGQAPEKKPE